MYACISLRFHPPSLPFLCHTHAHSTYLHSIYISEASHPPFAPSSFHFFSFFIFFLSFPLLLYIYTLHSPSQCLLHSSHLHHQLILTPSSSFHVSWCLRSSVRDTDGGGCQSQMTREGRFACLALTLSVCASPSLYLLTHALSFCICLSLFLSFSVCFCLYLSFFLSLSISVSVSLSLLDFLFIIIYI